MHEGVVGVLQDLSLIGILIVAAYRSRCCSP